MNNLKQYEKEMREKYKKAENINKTFSRIFECVSKFSNNFELIFVDDGSSDDSFSKLYLLSKQNKNLKIIKLSKNFGHQNAIFAGLENSSGDCIFTIDASLLLPIEIVSPITELSYCS